MSLLEVVICIQPRVLSHRLGYRTGNTFCEPLDDSYCYPRVYCQPDHTMEIFPTCCMLKLRVERKSTWKLEVHLF